MKKLIIVIVGAIAVTLGIMIIRNRKEISGEIVELKDMFFSDYVKSNKDSFAKRVLEVSESIGTDPNALMSVMFKESGLNHEARNKQGGAVGLIQFMPNTAKSLGTTSEALLKMSNVEQLDYVEKYFKPYKGKVNKYSDLYLVTFFPAAMNHDDNWLFQTNKLSKELIGKQNPTINKGAPINKIAFRTYLMARIPKEYSKFLN